MPEIRSRLLALVMALAPTVAGAQTLSLQDALDRADRGAYANRIAAGTATARSAEEWAALGGVLPTVRFESGYGRTTDPISAFGIALRQRRISQSDFDPVRLNHPDPISNYTGAVVLEQPILNLDAHLGRVVASRLTAASRASERWTRASTRVEVIRAYYGVVLAREMVTTLEASSEAGHAHLRQAESMVRNGLVTRSDALLAAIRAGEVDVQLAEARGNASIARSQLATLLGAPAELLGPPPLRLPDLEAIRGLEARDWGAAVDGRGDVTAARAAAEAAQAARSRAASLYLPRLNAVARYDWNSPDRKYADERNWTVGVMLSWTPLSGGAQLAATRAARGHEVAARAGAEAIASQARLQVEQAENDWTVALERLRVSGDAVAQSAEAHRIVVRRYKSGLATVLELLNAAATETESSLRFSSARYEAITATAERLRARGMDPAEISILDSPSTAVFP